VAVASAGLYASLHLIPENHANIIIIIITTSHHSVFYRPDALPAAQPTESKHRRHELFTVSGAENKFYFLVVVDNTPNYHPSGCC